MDTVFTDRTIDDFSKDEIAGWYADLTASGKRMYLYWYSRTRSHDLATLLATTAYHDQPSYERLIREAGLYRRGERGY